jgi:hypothetical protein
MSIRVEIISRFSNLVGIVLKNDSFYLCKGILGAMAINTVSK